MSGFSSVASRREALALLGVTAGSVGAGGMGPAAAAAVTPGAPWTGGGEIAVAGGRMHYATLGEGRPLVMLHKLGGWIADWRRLAPLVPDRRLVAIDLPGHGGSRMCGPAPRVVTIGESAAMILAVLDQLGIDRFDLVGNSIGGVIAIVVAATCPERVGRLALVSTMMSEPVSLAELDARERGGGGPIAAVIRSPEEQRARFGTVDPRISEEQAASNRLAGDWKPASERGAALAGPARYLPRIKAPVLVISADRGAYLKYDAVARAGLADVRIATVADTGSFVHQERPEETARLLNAFLAG